MDWVTVISIITYWRLDWHQLLEWGRIFTHHVCWWIWKVRAQLILFTFILTIFLILKMGVWYFWRNSSFTRCLSSNGLLSIHDISPCLNYISHLSLSQPHLLLCKGRSYVSTDVVFWSYSVTGVLLPFGKQKWVMMHIRHF